MNTRLQVEHPVTEMVTGVDLVHWQLRIVQGERLTLDPEQMMQPDGHAIECRVYAEDPEAGFIPCPGLITSLQTPAGPGIRDDSGVAAGFEVPIYYDSMVSKLVAWAGTRDAAIDRMRRALTEYQVGGLRTTIPFFRWILQHPDFIAGRFDTGFLDRVLGERTPGPFVTATPEVEDLAVLTAAIRAADQPGEAPPAREAAASSRARWRQAARLDGLRD